MALPRYGEHNNNEGDINFNCVGLMCVPSRSFSSQPAGPFRLDTMKEDSKADIEAVGVVVTPATSSSAHQPPPPMDKYKLDRSDSEPDLPFGGPAKIPRNVQEGGRVSPL